MVSFGTAFLVTLIASGAGYAFSRFRFGGKAAVIAIMLLTQMFPLVMLIAPIYRLMTPLGLTDSLIGLIIVYTAFNVPFATFLMQSFFDGIPKELEESAMIDGCTPLFRPLARDLPTDAAGHGGNPGLCLHRRLVRTPVRADADQCRGKHDVCGWSPHLRLEISRSTGGR